MKRIAIVFLCSFFIIASCKKKTGDVQSQPPSNLNITAVVSMDNSGNVAFTATASNAVSYDFDFGNGVFQTVPSGAVTYKYTASGTYLVNVIAKNSGGQTISKSISVTVAVTLSLVWSEEFNTPGAPDASKWTFETGTGSNGWGNNEAQYYTNRSVNVAVANGNLKITAIKEAFSGSNYTSARIITKDKFSFKYGKVEARAKLPAGIGTWPAIWMLGNNISTVGWPACGEIDIMEHVGAQQNKIYGTLHYPGFSGGSAVGGTVNIPNVSTEFHKYAVEWTAATIKFYVDDNIFFTFSNNSGLPFNQNFFLILNVAMGGSFGGTIDPAFTSASMELDYLRIYQ